LFRVRLSAYIWSDTTLMMHFYKWPYHYPSRNLRLLREKDLAGWTIVFVVPGIYLDTQIY
jgi:hypothetical protein